MWHLLDEVISSAKGWTELRYHDRIANKITITKGKLIESSSVQQKGVGIRVLIDGAWGFSSTSRIEKQTLIKAVAEATSAAKVASKKKINKTEGLQTGQLAKGDFKPQIDDPVTAHSLKEKMDLVKKIEEKTRKASPRIQSATCSYTELLDEKYIITSDGARAHILDAKPEFKVVAVAQKNGEMQTSLEAAGITGGWTDLFKKHTPEEMSQKAAQLAVDLLPAPYPEGGRAWVVLDPALVGVLAHEAIGHTVEADWVLSGSIVKGKLGQKVASELITMIDSGKSEIKPHAGGILPVDDEGTLAKKTTIIDHGVLRSYLHNRETAKMFGVAPTGNARAWTYIDEPIIRMRNTYIEPGDKELQELISEIKEGYFLKGLGGGGQADSNAEFMFTVKEARKIKNGKVGELVKNAAVSGQAFDVLKSCNGMSRDFEWAIGSGHCGKGQPAKVDAGGPYLRCKLIVGGK